MTTTKKLTLIAVLVAQAIVLHLLESFIPIPLPIPGVKLGLANIITLLALILFDFKTALAIAFWRTLLGSLLSGTLFNIGFFLAICGAIFAALVMYFLLLFQRLFRATFSFSILGISVAGAVAHNLGQLAMAALLIKNTAIFYYLPVMLVASVPTGLFTGWLLKELLKYIESSGIIDDFSF